MATLSLAELASSASMIVVATVTVRAGALCSLKQKEARGPTEAAAPVLDTQTAVMFPVCASLMLLAIFFLFQYLQSVIVAYMCTTSFFAVSFVAHGLLSVPACRCSAKARAVGSAAAGAAAVVLWLFTSHWFCVDLLGVSICVTMIAFLRLPSLRVAAIVLCGLFVYDVFWVFFSERFFGSNVMVEVATKNAANPVDAVGDFLDIPLIRDAAPTLVLPLKLLFPAQTIEGVHLFHMLGLGDIAIPGLFVSFALNFDEWLRDGGEDGAKARDLERGGGGDDDADAEDALLPRGPGGPAPPRQAGGGYFRLGLRMYVVGLVVSVAMSRIFHAAQPALLYLVPCVTLPIAARGHRLGHLGHLWRGVEEEEDHDA